MVYPERKQLLFRHPFGRLRVGYVNQSTSNLFANAGDNGTAGS